jgi:hypothetical protein
MGHGDLLHGRWGQRVPVGLLADCKWRRRILGVGGWGSCPCATTPDVRTKKVVRTTRKRCLATCVGIGKCAGGLSRTGPEMCARLDYSMPMDPALCLGTLPKACLIWGGSRAIISPENEGHLWQQTRLLDTLCTEIGRRSVSGGRLIRQEGRFARPSGSIGAPASAMGVMQFPAITGVCPEGGREVDVREG